MRRNVLLLMMLFFCVIPASCATVNIDSNLMVPIHKYNGVSNILVPYVDQWMDLAKDRGLSFQHIVNIGFVNIEAPSVGITRYEDGFREIDIDPKFWERSTEIQKNQLIWHELAHAYCDRSHDYGKDKEYGDDVGLAMKKQKQGGVGFYPDHCPASLMFPALVPDVCFRKYYFQYVDEMFENCNPY